MHPCDSSLPGRLTALHQEHCARTSPGWSSSCLFSLCRWQDWTLSRAWCLSLTLVPVAALPVVLQAGAQQCNCFTIRLAGRHAPLLTACERSMFLLVCKFCFVRPAWSHCTVLQLRAAAVSAVAMVMTTTGYIWYFCCPVVDTCSCLIFDG